MKKKKCLVFFFSCPTAWPGYRLKNGKKWPLEESINYNTIQHLDLFCHRAGKQSEVSVSMYSSLQNNHDLCQLCKVDPALLPPCPLLFLLNLLLWRLKPPLLRFLQSLVVLLVFLIHSFLLTNWTLGSQLLIPTEFSEDLISLSTPLSYPTPLFLQNLRQIKRDLGRFYKLSWQMYWGLKIFPRSLISLGRK